MNNKMLFGIVFMVLGLVAIGIAMLVRGNNPIFWGYLAGGLVFIIIGIVLFVQGKNEGYKRV